jgi:hypothetical protein
MVASFLIFIAFAVSLASADGLPDLYRRMPAQKSPYYGQGGPQSLGRIKTFKVEKNLGGAGMHAGGASRDAFRLSRPERAAKFDLSKFGAKGAETCSLCLNVADMELQALLNYILNGNRMDSVLILSSLFLLINFLFMSMYLSLLFGWIAFLFPFPSSLFLSILSSSSAHA